MAIIVLVCMQEEIGNKRLWDMPMYLLSFKGLIFTQNQTNSSQEDLVIIENRLLASTPGSLTAYYY
jgi:hypothetical protein